jgi:hypothetical protein
MVIMEGKVLQVLKETQGVKVQKEKQEMVVTMGHLQELMVLKDKKVKLDLKVLLVFLEIMVLKAHKVLRGL